MAVKTSSQNWYSYFISHSQSFAKLDLKGAEMCMPPTENKCALTLGSLTKSMTRG